MKLLRAANHDVTTASELSMSQASDIDLLVAARQDSRIMLTRDRDFGSLVFVNAMQGGVIYLRIVPSALRAVHNELLHILGEYDEQTLRDSLVVVEPGRHRVRRISP